MKARPFTLLSLIVVMALLVPTEGQPSTARAQPTTPVAAPDRAQVTNDPHTFSESLSSDGVYDDNPFFVAITDNDEMYAFPTLDEPQQGYFIGTGNVAAVADFDNDGFCEVLAARTSDRLLRLYESDGNTGFIETVVSDDAYPPVDFTPYSSDSAVGDFDNNHLLDFAFTGRRCTSEHCPPGGQGLIQLHLNRGNGHFERQSIDVNGVTGRSWERMWGLDDGDFNMDGSPDLAAQQYWDGSNNITHLLLGNGDATFVDSPSFTNANTGGTLSLVSGDFNNDGYLDLIVGQDDDGDPGQTWLYLGNGTGAFTYFGPAYDTNPTHEPGSGWDRPGQGISDAYDFDSDGNLDVVAAAKGIGLLLFKGNGDGSFQAPLTLNSGANWYRVAVLPDSQPRCKWRGGPGSAYQLSLPFPHSPDETGLDRIWSFFDHEYPLLPTAVGGSEPQNSDIGDTTLLFTGQRRPGILFACNPGVSCYSGHNGYDFTYNLPEGTAVLAAAEGDITSGTDSCGGNFVKINHGSYQTVYFHLKDDAHWRKSGHVNAGDRIGSVGSSGTCTTGPHLHFAAYHDRDADGTFETDELIDPYGFNPTQVDPWTSTFTDARGRQHTGTASTWLWEFSLPIQVDLSPGTEQALVTSDGVRIDVPANAVGAPALFAYTIATEPDQGTGSISIATHQAATDTGTVATGHTFLLSAVYSDGVPVGSLAAPMKVTVPYTDSDLTYVDESTLRLFSWDEVMESWMPFTTTLDVLANEATATTGELGIFSLRAQPLNPVPTIVNATPNLGSNATETEIVVTGTNFISLPWVNLGVAALDVHYVSSTTLTLTVPSGLSAGTYTMTLRNPDGQRASLRDAFAVRVNLYLPLIIKNH